MSHLRSQLGYAWNSRRASHGVLAAALAVLLGYGVPAEANLVITPTFDSSITSDPNAAAIENTIETAIQTYENSFSDPINVTIRFQEMTTGLGQSNWFFYNLSYTTFLNALKADAKTGNDAIALAHLPKSSLNPVTGNGFINLKTADIRALGIAGNFPSGLAGGVDGIVGLNTHITDIGSPGSSGQYSLLATTEHEINEVLGLGSALPSIRFGSPFPEDLYRYDQAGNRSFAAGGAGAFFSIDGTTRLAQFNNRNNGGDFGDWQSNPRPSGVPPQVQDAFATPGAHPTLGVELTALDVIGYDPIAIPEPSSLVAASTGVLILLGYAWRRRKRVA
jgi:hypothetical protein